MRPSMLLHQESSEPLPIYFISLTQKYSAKASAAEGCQGTKPPPNCSALVKRSASRTRLTKEFGVFCSRLKLFFFCTHYDLKLILYKWITYMQRQKTVDYFQFILNLWLKCKLHFLEKCLSVSRRFGMR